jgi:hypothetical protein
MNQTQQFAPTISCKANQALEIAKRTLDQVLRVVQTISLSATALQGFSSFSSSGSESAVSDDCPGREDTKDFLTVRERISSYAELQKLIHEALRIQNPEWIGADGKSEMCEFYEARFAKLIARERPSVKIGWQGQGV